MKRYHYRIEVLRPGNVWITCMSWWGMSMSKAEGAWMVLKAFSGNPSIQYRLVKYPIPGDYNTPGETLESFAPYTVKVN